MIISLDIGDVWTGTAYTDLSEIFVYPGNTLKTNELLKDLELLILEKKATKIIIGLPLTMKGQKSEQTNKTIQISNKIKEKFKNIEIKLFDERLSSLFAKKIQIENKTQNKLKEHSIAAAIILENYLSINKK